MYVKAKQERYQSTNRTYYRKLSIKLIPPYLNLVCTREIRSVDWSRQESKNISFLETVLIQARIFFAIDKKNPMTALDLDSTIYTSSKYSLVMKNKINISLIFYNQWWLIEEEFLYVENPDTAATIWFREVLLR